MNGAEFLDSFVIQWEIVEKAPEHKAMKRRAEESDGTAEAKVESACDSRSTDIRSGPREVSSTGE